MSAENNLKHDELVEHYELILDNSVYVDKKYLEKIETKRIFFTKYIIVKFSDSIVMIWRPVEVPLLTFVFIEYNKIHHLICTQNHTIIYLPKSTIILDPKKSIFDIVPVLSIDEEGNFERLSI